MSLRLRLSKNPSPVMKRTTPTVLGMKYDVTAVPAEMMNIINNLQRKRKKDLLEKKDCTLRINHIEL